MHRSSLLTGTALLWAVALSTPITAADGFTVSLPASGRHEAVMPVSKWGRYSIQAKGDQPVAISVADRRSGILHRDGEPGQRNGRIDLFLDIGDYKLAAQGVKKASGNATLSAIPFAYPSGMKPSWLIPLRENRFSLDDLQQAAFWFETPSDTVVYIEAAGRNLAEIALWRDGEWLVPTNNRSFTAKPKDETPLSGFSFAVRVPKGAYMVGLYGGKGRAWALKSEEHPCYLQWGVEPIAANVRSQRTVPPKGYSQVLLAPEVTNVIVEGADKQRLLVEISRMNADFTAGGWMAGDSIHGKSAGPRVMFQPSGIAAGQGWRLLKVSGPPGRPFNLQTFGAGSRQILGNQSASWKIHSVHSGSAGDQIGASAIIVDNKDGAVIALQADTVGPKELARKFNLLGSTTALIYVAEAGKYTFNPGGTKYAWTLGRFYHRPPPNYKEPETFTGAKTIELNQGVHHLTLEPQLKGVATFVLGKASLLGGMISAGKAAVGVVENRAWDAPRASVSFPNVHVPYQASYDLRLNSQAPEFGSLVAQKLPLPPEPAAAANPTGPAPEFPDAKREALAKFPVLPAGKTAFLDLDRGSNQPYAVRVAEAGLYRIETTGRLETSLSLSDRFRHFRRQASANGVGRNALMIEYLLPGEYQVVVAPGGNTGGRLGLAAYRNALAEGGALEPGIDNRKFVEQYAGSAYEIRIANAGKYRLESLGQNGAHALRLEDKDGWPLEPAMTPGVRTAQLAKGEYRLISLPIPQEGRRIARLIAILEKRSIKGKGPHPLSLNATLASTWMDDGGRGAAGDSVGKPSVFAFSLPSPINAKLNVSNGFNATLYRTGTDTAIAAWSGNRKQALPAGEYRMLVAPEKKRNLAPYQVSVGTRELVPGLSFDLTRKETFAVSLGAPSIVEFGSQGMLDVTATLLADDGKTVIATNDDGFLDWNFSISRALKAGRYFLRTESAEPGFTSTTVFMRALTDTLMDSLSSSNGKAKTAAVRLNRRLGVFPLAAGAGDVVACAAVGKSRIGLSLEKSAAAGQAWVPVAQAGGLSPSLAVPRAAGAQYRLKAWSETNTDEAMSVAYLAAAAQTADAKAAASGLSGSPQALGADFRAWFKVDLGGHAPGHFRAVPDQNPLASLAASTQIDSAFESDGPAMFASTARTAWVELRFEQDGRFRVKLEPMTLEHGRPVAIELTGGRPRVFETVQGAQRVGLLVAEADGANPLVGVLSGEASKDVKGPRFSVRGLAVNQGLWLGEGRSAAVALPGDARRIAVWNGLPPLDGTQPTAKLAWTELPLEQAGTLAPGVAAWNPGKAAARLWHLPAPRGAGVRLRVTLPPNSAAFLKRADGSASLECDFEGEPQVREFRAQGGDLYLLALDANARFDVALFASAEGRDETLPLAVGAGRLLDLSREGVTLLPIAADKPHGFHFRGAVRGVDWIGADGRLRADLYSGAMVGPGGMLALRHGPGMAQLDLCDAKDAAGVMACKWGATLAPSGAGEISQSSLAGLHERVNWFAFAIKDTQHVNFSAPLPVAAILLKDGAPVRYQEAWERFNWDLPLAPGRYSLGLRPFAGASLEGGSLATLFRPMSSLSEKKPYTAFMGPGESRLLRFDVARKADFGIGLRMSKETVEARLYDAQGRVVAQGKQQFAQLAPGTYHLWLRVPEGAEGTEVTASLFGQEAPPNDPPEKLVKWIITGGAGERPSVETDQAADPDEMRPAWERFLKRESYRSPSGDGEAAPEGGEGGNPEVNEEGGEGGEGGDGSGEGEGESASANGEGGEGEGE